ncbi:MAG TPA: chromosome partitioning protein ParB [Xanthomonadales bacterium]|nr:chromosome partitioning protein ParB [Xanthomonadales bacterium]
MATRKRGLGRGLSALLSPTDSGPDLDSSDGELRSLPISTLQPGRYQPRTGMDSERLAELAESIRAQGVIQPIVVRGLDGGRYEIIAGERRWRAAQLAELREVPVLVRDVDDRAVMAMALIENIQREDLNPLDQAQALHRLIDEFELTHQQVAEAVGRSRAAVTNLLRLLDLPAPVRALLEARRIEMGHARALLTLPAEIAETLAHEAADQGLSVRQVEERAKRLAETRTKPSQPAPSTRDPDIASLERELSETLNARVAIEHGRGGRGKLIVHYHGADALDGVLERLGLKRPT